MGDSFQSRTFPRSASHSRQSSTNSIGLDSIPVSPAMSSFSSGHARNHSSTSSLSSSPPSAFSGFDFLDQSTSSSKRSAPSLPKVAEVPEEARDAATPSEVVVLTAAAHEAASTRGFSFDYRDERDWSSTPPGGAATRLYHDPDDEDDDGEPFDYSMRDSVYADSDYVVEPHSKRRRSTMSGTFDDFAERMASRFPSLSRRARSRKRGSAQSMERAKSEHPSMSAGVAVSGASSQQPTAAGNRSRSTSRARSLFRRSKEIDSDQRDQFRECTASPHCIETIAEDDDYEVVDADGDPVSAPSCDEIENIAIATTPLLPPVGLSRPHSPIHSPLDSPAIVPSASFTPVDSGVLSPPLSAKPSCQSVKHHFSLVTSQMTPTSDIPPLIISDANDAWADRLGHANFHIYPAPYAPADASLDSAAQVMSDWEQARSEFSKHLGRTATHFGESSKIYRLTEEKWATIDAEWKQSYECVLAGAAARGEAFPYPTPSEPPPVAKIPVMEESGHGIAGKWPGLGDCDIVGPMQVVAPLNQQDQQKHQGPAGTGHERKRSRVMRLFSGLGRLSTG